jgi:hypothetical protein
MSSKTIGSALAGGLVTVSLVACLGVSAAAAAGNEQQSPIARNGIDTAHGLYNYAGPGSFAPARYPRPGYTLNHDAWLRD